MVAAAVVELCYNLGLLCYSVQEHSLFVFFQHEFLALQTLGLMERFWTLVGSFVASYHMHLLRPFELGGLDRDLRTNIHRLPEKTELDSDLNEGAEAD